MLGLEFNVIDKDLKKCVNISKKYFQSTKILRKWQKIQKKKWNLSNCNFLTNLKKVWKDIEKSMKKTWKMTDRIEKNLKKLDKSVKKFAKILKILE